MSMASTLKKFFYNSRYADEVGYKLPKQTFVRRGVWDFENYTSYDNGDIRISVGIDDSFLGVWKISISIDYIKVYDNKWIHEVPEKMKLYVKEQIRLLDEFNKQCKKDKVYKSYKQRVKEREYKNRQRKIESFEREKQALIDKFK